MSYTFSKNLKRLRREKNITQQELADKIGVAQSTLCAWEGNEYYPTLDRIYDLSKALDVPVYKLIK